MRYSRAQRGPFNQRLFFSVAEIDDICVTALQSVGLLPKQPESIRIDRFVEKYFSDAQIEYRDLAPEILGCTVFSARGAVTSIIIADKQDSSLSGERRLRSTTAHEAGHGLMHASLFIDEGLQRDFQGSNIDVKGRRILCRPADIGPAKAKAYDGRWWEWQANRAIGGLLLPKKLVNEALQPIFAKSPVTGIHAIPINRRVDAKDIISETFNVNPVVAEIRLSEMFPAADSRQMMF